MKRRLVVPGAVATSAALHAALLAAGAWLLAGTLGGEDAPPAASASVVEVTVSRAGGIELPTMSTASGSTLRPSDAVPVTERVPVGGGDEVPRPDTRRGGRGGIDAAERAALNLSDSVDGLTLDRDPQNAAHRSQVQRLRTARERRTRDDRRATPNPMELSFLASGKGGRRERRPPSPFDPSRGGNVGDEASAVGGLLGAPRELGDGTAHALGASEEGSDRDRLGAGVADGALGTRYTRRARVVLARPAVRRARAAVPSNRRGRPNDTQDSSQEVASAVSSLIHASTAGGRRREPGPGGEKGPASPASGGRAGPGSKAQAAGRGGSPDSGIDSRVSGYWLGIRRQLRPHWRDAFPQWAILEGRGGMAVVSLRISKSGAVDRVRIARRSGIPEYDRNVLAAVQRAAPFGPLPAALGAGPVTITITFDSRNPAVGRHGKGPGRLR